MQTEADRIQFINPFRAGGRWYKANLHTHTTRSDGDSDVQERIRQYKEHAYSVLAITDHCVTNDVRGLSTNDFLVISGVEAHPLCPSFWETGFRHHLVCLDVPADMGFEPELDTYSVIRQVEETGGLVIFAHPYWSGFNINHVLEVDRFAAVEVYNATCTKRGRGYSSVHWDELLECGRVVSAVAVDDVHGGRDMFMGWTMIKAPELTTKVVMSSLLAGCFYSSCGPTIDDFRVEDGKAYMKCSPAAEVHFACRGTTGRSFYSDAGEPITDAEIDVTDSMRYVRVEVVDERGRHAWTNPVMLPCEYW